MRTERKRLLCKISTVVGSVIILLPNGLLMYWGNLSVCASSYIAVYLQSPYGVEAPWVISLYTLSWTLSIMAYSTVRTWIGKHWAFMLGCISTELGIFASYFAVQTSFALLIFTIAVMIGIGTGFLYGHLLRSVVDWAHNDVACLISIMNGSFNWGTAIINQLATLYLNPSNATPNVLIGSSTYFSQKKILEKVPSLFLVLGAFSFASHFIGFCLLRDNVLDKLTKESNEESQEEIASINGGGIVDNTNTQTHITSSSNLDKSTSHGTGHGSSHPEEENQTLPLSQGIDYTPKEVLRTATFYVLWVIFFFAEYPLILLLNYYKSFGQTWIHDDHFLAILGTSLAVTNSWMRIVWGVLIDKIGLRKCLSVQTFLVVLGTVWFYFTPILNKWLYFVSTNLLVPLSCILYGGSSIIALVFFGKTNLSTNFGLLRSSSVILNIVCPFMTEVILKYFGWFYNFSSAAFVNIISLLLILFCIPQI